MNLALLIGNTRLRYALHDGMKFAETGSLLWSELAIDFQPLREVVQRALPEEILVGSVRDDRLVELMATLPDRCPDPRVVGRDFPVPIENRYSNPREVGVDRLLNALAASHRWPSCSAVVLDFGTALSVSVVTPDGAFAGGVIACGLGAALSALRSYTPKLPAVLPEPPQGFLQTSTEAGLRAGVYWQFAGGAQRLLDGLRQELTPPVHVVATGGDAELLAPGVAGIDCVDLDLTLEGLVLAGRGRRK